MFDDIFLLRIIHSSAIIADTNGNNNAPFIFLLAMGILSCLFLYFVDIEKSRKECAEFLDAETKHDAFVQ